MRNIHFSLLAFLTSHFQIMHSQHLPMHYEDFEIIPKKLGWKYEYWDNKAHITPGYQVVSVSIETKPYPVTFSQSQAVAFSRSQTSDWKRKIRPVSRNDELQLIRGFLAAFKDTVDYCDWNLLNIEDSARDSIRDFFMGKRGTPLPVSCAAMEKGCIIGAAIIVEKNNKQPFLDFLFVIPEWQRKGVGSALISYVINELYAVGMKSLMSRYLLANEASRAWHQKFGFTELPDLLLARHYYVRAKEELWRREKIGDITDTERELLISQINQRLFQIEELEKIADQRGMKAVMPILRY